MTSKERSAALLGTRLQSSPLQRSDMTTIKKGGDRQNDGRRVRRNICAASRATST